MSQANDEIAQELGRLHKNIVSHRYTVPELPSTKIVRSDRFKDIERITNERVEDPRELQRLTREYQERFPGVLNFDNACEMFPEYLENVTANYSAVGHAADVLVDSVYRAYLKDKNIKEIEFIGGGPGSGKGTFGTKDKGKPGKVYFDCTLGCAGDNYRSFIKLALLHDKKSRLSYCFCTIEQSTFNTLSRAAKIGRCVTESTMANQHFNGLGNALDLQEFFADEPNFSPILKLIVNTGTVDQVHDVYGEEATKRILEYREGYGDKESLLERTRVAANTVYQKNNVPYQIIEHTSGTQGAAQAYADKYLRVYDRGEDLKPKESAELTKIIMELPLSRLYGEFPKSARQNIIDACLKKPERIWSGVQREFPGTDSMKSKRDKFAKALQIYIANNNGEQDKVAQLMEQTTQSRLPAKMLGILSQAYTKRQVGKAQSQDRV